MRIRSFKGLRPSAESVNGLVSLPYDVVSTEEARALAEGKPESMLRLVRAEINFPEGQDPYADEVYNKAVEQLKWLQSEGHLVRESKEAMYVYQQTMGEHTQRGIVALSHVGDYDDNKIKKHEKTRVVKENDRTRLTSDLNANTGPVFLTYKDSQSITQIVNETVEKSPLYDLTSDDGIRHTVWELDNPEIITTEFQSVPFTYVADGHHRAASAARVGRERSAANPNHSGDEDYNWFLTVLFPGSELKILPYNRYVHDLNGHSASSLLTALREIAEVKEDCGTEPSHPGDVRFFLDEKWYGIELKAAEDADPVSKLDVTLLQDLVLSPLLGIGDPRTDERIEFIGGIRGTDHLEMLANKTKSISFSLYPVTIQQLIDIADADQIMPPKSTWFEPKLRSGFFIHTF